MNARFRFSFSLIALCVLAPGCHPRQTELVPPTVHYGQSVCDGCGMIVSDEHYAAALIVQSDDGEQRSVVFDDIGCMLDYQRKHSGEAVLARFVKDINTGTWLSVAEATFVRGDGVRSPMGYGIAACSTPAAAHALVAGHGGSIQPIEQLLENKPAAATKSAATQPSVTGGNAS